MTNAWYGILFLAVSPILLSQVCKKASWFWFRLAFNAFDYQSIISWSTDAKYIVKPRTLSTNFITPEKCEPAGGCSANFISCPFWPRKVAQALYWFQKEMFSNYLRQEIIAVFYFIWEKIIEKHRKHYRRKRNISASCHQPIRTWMSKIFLLFLSSMEMGSFVPSLGCCATLAEKLERLLFGRPILIIFRMVVFLGPESSLKGQSLLPLVTDRDILHFQQ